MQLTMSMFATQADYWKAVSGLNEGTVAEVASELGCAADNEVLLVEIAALKNRAARWDAVETLMILGDVELTQAEDGGYRIFVEPVENILPTAWDGNTPDEVADKVIAQLTTPNAK